MNIVKVPFPLPAYKVGDEVPVAEFMAAVGAYVSELEAENAGLRERLLDAEAERDEAKDELETIEENMRDYYRPLNPYIVNGVSARDF